jgi:OmpR-family two-component system manganese-sensing response regulator
MAKFLLVEDDVEIANQVKDAFALRNLPLEIAFNGEDALQLLHSFNFDLILLDWNLPGISGLDVCKKYRAGGGNSFIIFLTAIKDIDSKESALAGGGDDYIVKPFEIREILARIQSIMRRSLDIRMEALSVRGLSFDAQTRVVKAGDTELQLTRKEANLLEYLMRNVNRPFNAQQLLSAVWPSDTDADVTTVRTWMRNLRVKLGTLGMEDFIKTVPAVGYVIEA